MESCGLYSEAMGTVLLFFKRADWRYLESDTNPNIWLKGNSDDNDVRIVFISLDQWKVPCQLSGLFPPPWPGETCAPEICLEQECWAPCKGSGGDFLLGDGKGAKAVTSKC